jgi:hypothetical protein
MAAGVAAAGSAGGIEAVAFVVGAACESAGPWLRPKVLWDPEQHDGSVERLIVVGLFIVAAAIFALAAVEWRRTPLSA